jgi:hypothetical protein
MKKILFLIAISAFTSTMTNADYNNGYNAKTNSSCYGGDVYRTCTDYNSGNTYNISKYGNTTQVQANNYRTGESWSQTTNRYGNQSNTSGYDKDGNQWNHNTNKVGNTTYYNGNDSKGSYYNGSCNSMYGCQTNRFEITKFS